MCESIPCLYSVGKVNKVIATNPPPYLVLFTETPDTTNGKALPGDGVGSLVQVIC